MLHKQKRVRVVFGLLVYIYNLFGRAFLFEKEQRQLTDSAIVSNLGFGIYFHSSFHCSFPILSVFLTLLIGDMVTLAINA